MKTSFLFLLLFVMCSELAPKQLTAEEEKLYSLIMEHRKGNSGSGGND